MSPMSRIGLMLPIGPMSRISPMLPMLPILPMRLSPRRSPRSVYRCVSPATACGSGMGCGSAVYAGVGRTGGSSGW